MLLKRKFQVDQTSTLEKARKDAYEAGQAEKEVSIKNLKNLLTEVKGKDWDDFK